MAKHKTAVKVKAKRVLRDEGGKLLPGTRGISKGRPVETNTKLSILLRSIQRVEEKLSKKKGKQIRLLDHFVLQAFRDNSVLIAVMKKLCPDLKSVEVQAGLGTEMADGMAEGIQKKLRERYNAKKSND